MATKSKKKRSKKRQENQPTLDQVRRVFARGDLRQALKDARALYRKQPDEEVRGLFECILVARVQQLIARGMRDEASRIADELLELGVTEPSVQAALPESLLSLGRLDRVLGEGQADDQQIVDELRIKAADHALSRPDDIPASMPEIREGSMRIRSALKLLAEGSHEQALAQLVGIARQSPFADWVFFVRGLAAYYSRDDEAMRRYWTRLAPDRLAARIAEPLFWLAGNDSWEQADDRVQRPLKQLERELTGRSVVQYLATLARHNSNGAARSEVFFTFRALRSELRNDRDGLLGRLSRSLILPHVFKGEARIVARLARMLEPLPTDPHWNRLTALTFDKADEEDEELAIGHWRKYLAEIDRIPALLAEDRKIVRGLVLLHVARDAAASAHAARHCPCPEPHDDDIEAFERIAIRDIERAIACLPTYARAYEELAELHEGADRFADAAAAYQRLLEAIPDHINTLEYLATYYLRIGAPLRALEFGTRLHTLKPLSSDYLAPLWRMHLEAARFRLSQGDVDGGLAEFDSADQLFPERKDSYEMIASRAVFAKKAGDDQLACQLIERAVDSLQEPVACWLLLAFESARYELPETETGLYEKRWFEALRRRRKASSMAHMCKSLLNNGRASDDRGALIKKARERYVRHLLPYVRRGAQLKWEREDLSVVCQFLLEQQEFDTARKFVKRGCRLFPDAPGFHLHAGMLELRKPPERIRFEQIRKNVTHAITLAERDASSESRQIITAARKLLSLLDVLEQERYLQTRRFATWMDDDSED